MKKLLWLFTMIFLVGCSSIDTPSPELFSTVSGPSEELRIGIYQDRELAMDETKAILSGIQIELLKYGIRVNIPWIRPWTRPAFNSAGLIQSIVKLPLEDSCDRILVIVGRNSEDFVWGLFLPEMLGGVENVTSTKGYVVGEVGSLNQAASGISPTEAAVHEIFHMLGCTDEDNGDKCFAKISSLRSYAKINRTVRKNDFFPCVNNKGIVMWDRKHAEWYLSTATF